jgi:hypothetical protein
MHPHKIKKLEYRNDKDFIKEEFYKEISGRLPNMAKRNVSFTATFEKPVKKSRYGVTTHINTAVIEDSTDELFNISGKTTNQDLHDGSSIINYAYSKMIENSYPGKGYVGTKKQIATFVTEFGSSLKKDAETVITNDKIRNSRKSKIKFKLKQKQSLSIDLPKIAYFKKKKLNNNNIFYELGNYYKIESYTIENNIMTLVLSRYDNKSDT